MSNIKPDKNKLDNLAKTPFLEVNLNKVKESYEKISNHLTGVEIYYAMKCNPHPEIMNTIVGCGGSFEVSSAYEMKMAIKAGAKPESILFSNPIKTLIDIKTAYKAGMRCFAFDSYSEVDKLAEGAPGAKVYVRIAIPFHKSTVECEGKFGVSLDSAKDLMVYAKKQGLEPYGISFHVGSQMLDRNAWDCAIQHSAKLISMLKKIDIDLKFLDIGGGFPVRYSDVKRDHLGDISDTILNALGKYINKDMRIVAEPGRYLVAESGTMVSTIIGIAERFDKKWLHLDVGADNGLMESVQTANTLAFPVHDSKKSNNKDIFNLTGPTCDSQDTVLFDVPMSSSLEIGDKVYFECAGAYTTAFNGMFNGFPSPETYITDKK